MDGIEGFIGEYFVYLNDILFIDFCFLDLVSCYYVLLSCCFIGRFGVGFLEVGLVIMYFM